MPDVKEMGDNLAVFPHRGLGKADPAARRGAGAAALFPWSGRCLM